MTSCNLVETFRRFRGTYFLIRGGRQRQQASPKRWHISTRSHGVTCQKTVVRSLCRKSVRTPWLPVGLARLQTAVGLKRANNLLFLWCPVLKNNLLFMCIILCCSPLSISICLFLLALKQSCWATLELCLVTASSLLRISLREVSGLNLGQDIGCLDWWRIS